jgi:predicted PurR-regulated permease PerM
MLEYFKRIDKINKILVLVILVFVVLYFGSPFLMPFFFGVLFASLMSPFCNFLEKIKIPKAMSALVATLLVFIVLGALMFVFVSQINRFASNVSMFSDELQALISDIQAYITSLTDITVEDQSSFLQSRWLQLIDRIEPMLTDFLSSIFSTLISFLIVLIYTFLLLLYRDKIYRFALMYISDDKRDNFHNTATKINKVVFHYLWGRAKVMMILGIMYYIVFSIFGLPYALLLTIFGSLITIIPYLGPFISGFLPILFSFIFFDSIQKAIFFSILVMIIQLVESYVLEPLIIGKEVKLNPLIVIVAVIVGGLVWGIAGMILFVPMFAMFKIVAKNTSGLEPIGFLFDSTKKKKQE